MFIEIGGPEDEIELVKPEGVDLTWVHRGGRVDLVGDDRAGDNAPLIAAVTGTRWLTGQVQVFIHGEAQAVMHNLRPYIRKERGVDAEVGRRSRVTGAAAVPKTPPVAGKGTGGCGERERGLGGCRHFGPLD